MIPANLGGPEPAKRAVGAILFLGAAASGTLAVLLWWPGSPWRPLVGLAFGFGVLNAVEARTKH